MSNILLTDDAKEDINSSAKYYETKQIGLGHDFLDKIEESLEKFRQNPKQFPQIYGEVRKSLTNRFPHQILFVMKSMGIIVFAIFHSSRNPQKWKKRV